MKTCEGDIIAAKWSERRYSPRDKRSERSFSSAPTFLTPDSPISLQSPVIKTSVVQNSLAHRELPYYC